MTLFSSEGKTRMRDAWEEDGLVRAAQGGDLRAFDDLVRRHRTAATLIARSVLSDREAADDAVQDGFLAAYKALPRLAEPARFAGWLGTIVRHRALRIRAGERREPQPVDELILAHVPSIQADLEAEEAGAGVRCAVERLPEDLRAVTALYYLADWSVARISEHTGLPATTVKWRLHTGRKRLREMLSETKGETR